MYNTSSRWMIPCALCVPLVIASSALPARDSEYAAVAKHHHAQQAPKVEQSPLVELLRKATARYRDINVALSEGWVQATPCVSGPMLGAMGIHFTLPGRIGDGQLKADEPELLIYEPIGNGKYRLVGVEYVVLKDEWEQSNPNGGASVLEGHLLNFVGEPNRYGLPAFYEIHVWAWRDNPLGTFADFNTRVSCEKQPLADGTS